MKRKQQKISETDIEEYLCEQVEIMGGYAYKFASPGRANVPDRLCVFDGFVVFIEVKAPGKEPTEAQRRELNRLAEKNHWVFAVNAREGVRKALKKVKETMDV